jgi:hypothetical protein
MEEVAQTGEVPGAVDCLSDFLGRAFHDGGNAFYTHQQIYLTP